LTDKPSGTSDDDLQPALFSADTAIEIRRWSAIRAAWRLTGLNEFGLTASFEILVSQWIALVTPRIPQPL
jgi:hypothetical protein